MSSFLGKEEVVSGEFGSRPQPPSLSIERVENKSRLYLQGTISLDNVSAYRDQMINLLAEKPDLVELDLSRSELNGSAVIALLVSIQRFARTENRNLSIVRSQPKLLEMAGISGLLDILPFEPA